MKGGKWKVGERKLADHLGIEWQTLGDGFTWESDDLDETAAKGRHAWEVAAAKLASGDYDLLILDELTYAVTYGWVRRRRRGRDQRAGAAHQRGHHRARRGTRAHRDRRHGDRDAEGEARLRPGHQGAEGDRVLTMTDAEADRPWADIAPELFEYGPADERLGLLVWRFPEPLLAVSSAPLGGGLGLRQWVMNVQVPSDYRRVDPEVHLGDLASARGLPGPGVGMLTAVDLRTAWSADDGGARVDVSVGITIPTWAAAPDEPIDPAGTAPGTINIVAVVPARLFARRHGQRGHERHRGQGPGPVGRGCRCDRHGVRRRLRPVSRRRARRALRRPPVAMGGAPGPGGVPCRAGGMPGRGSSVITLVLGGARSGKSAVAERLAADMAPPVTYVATLEVGDDADLAARVERHRARRPAAWHTVQAGAQLPDVLRALTGSVLLDSLGPWVGALGATDIDAPGLCSALAGRDGDTVVVAEEVGLSVHPSTEEGRRFRDALGSLNQAVAAGADAVLLVVAGCTLRLDAPEVR